MSIHYHARSLKKQMIVWFSVRSLDSTLTLPTASPLLFSYRYDTLILASPISILCGVRRVKWYSPQKFLARNNLIEQGPETAERSYSLFLLCHHSDSLGEISITKKYEELTFNDDFMFCRILEKKPVFPGMIDLNLIKRGAHYSELNRSYVIYIRRFNIYKKGELHKYSFRNLCLEDPQIELGDETEKIFLCAEGIADDV